MINNSFSFYKILSILSLFLIMQFSYLESPGATDTTNGNSTGSTAQTSSDQLSCTLYRIMGTLQGSMGKAIATIAIIALGIGLFMGKLSWGLAVATALGIAMIFGSSSIVSWLSGGSFSPTSSDFTNCTTASGSN